MFSFVKHDTIIHYYISLCFYQTCFVVAVFLQPHIKTMHHHKSESTPKRLTTLSAVWIPFIGTKEPCHQIIVKPYHKCTLCTFSPLQQRTLWKWISLSQCNNKDTLHMSLQHWIPLLFGVHIISVIIVIMWRQL